MARPRSIPPEHDRRCPARVSINRFAGQAVARIATTVCHSRGSRYPDRHSLARCPMPRLGMPQPAAYASARSACTWLGRGALMSESCSSAEITCLASPSDAACK